MVMGETHRSLWYNSQDAYKFYSSPELVIGVVCDGCGSSPRSEVGAALTAEFTVNFCRKYFRDGVFTESLLRKGLLNLYDTIAGEIHTFEKSSFIENFLFTTVVGFLMTPSRTTVFSSGDGIWCVNDQWEDIDQNNRPGFLGYHLTRGDELPFKCREFNTDEVNRVLVSTDGLSKMFHHDQDGSRIIDDLFSRDEFFEHPVLLPKFLSRINGMKDDISLVMGKRFS